MVIAFAGRRIDAKDADVRRFPPHMIDNVRQRIRELFQQHDASALVGSGACGADLLAHEVAGALGLRRRMILPFPPERFREISVTDRSDPERWSDLFTHIVNALKPDDLVVLPNSEHGDSPYAVANEAILDHALQLAGPDGPSGVLAVIAWEGHSRGEGDLTESFATSARERGIEVAEILTQ